MRSFHYDLETGTLSFTKGKIKESYLTTETVEGHVEKICSLPFESFFHEKGYVYVGEMPGFGHAYLHLNLNTELLQSAMKVMRIFRNAFEHFDARSKQELKEFSFEFHETYMWRAIPTRLESISFIFNVSKFKFQENFNAISFPDRELLYGKLYENNLKLFLNSDIEDEDSIYWNIRAAERIWRTMKETDTKELLNKFRDDPIVQKALKAIDCLSDSLQYKPNSASHWHRVTNFEKPANVGVMLWDIINRKTERLTGKSALPQRITNCRPVIFDGGMAIFYTTASPYELPIKGHIKTLLDVYLVLKDTINKYSERR